MFLSRSQLRLLTLVFLLVTNLHSTNAQIDTSIIAHTIKVTRALYPSSSSGTDFAKGGVIKIEDSNSLSSTPISKTSGMHEARALPMHWVHANPSTFPDQKVRVDAVASPNQEGQYKVSVSGLVRVHFPRLTQVQHSFLDTRFLSALKFKVAH